MHDQTTTKQEIWDPDAYILEIEIDGTKFKFQCPDRMSMDTLGLELLASTFGRYKADEIRNKLAAIKN